MKLYTEEQVLRMFEVCRDSDLYEHILTFEDILKTETPIELPTQNDLDEILHDSLDEHACGYIRAIEHLEEQIKRNNKGGNK